MALCRETLTPLGIDFREMDEPPIPFEDARFDVVIDFAAPDRAGEYRQIVEALERQYPGYTFAVALDVDASD